jgi:hypothetical protein
MRKIVQGVFMMMVLTVCSGMPAYADEGTDSGWNVSVAPYAWLAGTSGTVTVKGHDSNVVSGFSDVLKNTDIAAQIQVEASKDGAGFFIQPNYLKLSSDATYTTPINGIKLNGDAKSDLLFMEFGGFWRIVQNFSGDAHRPGSIDFIVGLRYWDMSNELDVNVPAAGVSFDIKKDSSIIDPFIGFRIKTYLTDKVLFNGRADIGGLGTASSSNYTYNIVALFGYDITKSATLFGGYRALYVDYGESKNGCQMTMHGPLVGVSFTF